ncbi:MAG: hypothetical protein H7Y89_12205 [Steroidobacteraceae bacterium]|nr:hypothetical protein [Steroidobacteraceae bacterium]
MSARAITVAMALCFSVTALAGFREVNRTVVVNQTQRYASGHLAGARASTDATQHIACVATIENASTGDANSPASISQWGYCFAATATNSSAFCFSANPEMVGAMRNLQGDSLLEFRWNLNGQCTMVQLKQASGLEPKR